MMPPRRIATKTLLGLAVAASLFVCSSAFPATISHISLDEQQQSQRENTHRNDQIYPYYSSKDQITRQPSSLSKIESTPIISSSSSPSSPSTPATEIDALTSPTFPGRLSHQHQTNIGSYPGNSRSTRDQILHQCTTHFLEILDSDVSDHLVLRLSRLVMMLPVIGVETRAVMRAKVVQVMQQVSSRLTDYESIRRVIRSAVDDAGLLMLLDSDHTVVTNERRGKKGTKGGIRRIHYKDSSEYYDNNDRGDDKYYLETKGSLEDENETSESVWGRLQDVLRSTPRHGNQESSGSSSRNLKGVIDESQIPVVADIAMGAVLDYVAEILTPALVIHQLTEGIQSSLYQISKDKDFDQNNNNNDSEDSNEQDLDIGALSSQSISLSNGNQHGLNHLSDDWVWSSLSSTTDGTDKSEADDDSKGQDEDLWDKDMEIHDWDSTGRLFEDFEDTDGKEELDQKSDDNGDLERENWDSIREEDDSDSTYEEYYPNPFAVGIQEDDRYQQEDQEEDDDSYDGVEDFEHDGSMMPTFSKQKRSIVSNDISTPKPKSTYSSYSESLPIKFSKRNPSTVILKKRRLDIAPDLRLESLLAQLVEPVLTTFIEDDFPSSCKRAQGELMDGIIWSLDQADSITSIGNEDQLVLLSELEY